jgi:hypothetical protein
MTVLAVFGCSWAVGEEVAPENTFGAKLAKKLNSTEYVNLGISSSSNSRSVLQLLRYIKLIKDTDIPVEKSIAIFLITAPSRECAIIHHDQSLLEQEHIIDIKSGQKDAITQSWITHFSSEPNQNFNLHKNILSMQAICRQYSIRDYYIVGWSDVDLKLPGIDATKIYHKSCVQLFGYKDQDDFLKNPPNHYVEKGRHPNELGHELIAQTLYNWIIEQNNI